MFDRYNRNRYFASRREGFNWYTFKQIPLTYVILFVNIVFFIITYGLYQVSGIDLNSMFGRINYEVVNGEYWRLIMPIFLHFSLIHIAVNSYSLYIVGVQVEQIFGKAKFLLIYFIAGILGNILGFAFSAMNVLSVGASGAIFGLIGAMLYFALILRKRGLDKSLLTNILFIIAFNLIYGLTTSGIDNLAHIGGLIGGYAVAIALGVNRAKSNRQNMLIYLGGLAALTVILLYVGFSRA